MHVPPVRWFFAVAAVVPEIGLVEGPNRDDDAERDCVRTQLPEHGAATVALTNACPFQSVDTEVQSPPDDMRLAGAFNRAAGATRWFDRTSAQRLP